MKKLIALATLLLAQTTVSAQSHPRLATSPLPPPREALDRLHLKQAWRTYISVEGRRDGLFSVQLAGDQVLVQTRSGSVTALSALDGATLWTTRFGQPYRVNTPLGFNDKLLFAPRGTMLYALDRATGQVQWSYPMPGGASAAPVTDDERIFLTLGTGQFTVLEIPHASKHSDVLAAEERTKKAREMQEEKNKATTKEQDPIKAELDRRQGAYSSFGIRGQAFSSISGRYQMSDERERHGIGLQPRLLWEYNTSQRLEQPPLITDEHVILPGQGGTFLVMPKSQSAIPHRFETRAALSAPLGHHAELVDEEHILQMAYVPLTDYNLYAFNTRLGKVVWRFTASAPLLSQPMVSDEDIYVTASRAGLYRLNRKSGEAVWHNPQARRFLAANKKFVYAVDTRGQLLVLDRAGGMVRGGYDVHGFVVPVSNEWTDRLFLANHDGLVVCLHDKDYPTPLKLKTEPVIKPVETKPAEGEAKDKAEAKPKDEPKEKPEAKPKEEKPKEEKPKEDKPKEDK